MKRILLTGGAGFIGSNLTAKLLSSDDYRVVCIDNFDPFYPRVQKEANIRQFLKDKHYTFIEGDIRNRRCLELAGPADIIVHLAAKAGVRPSIQQPMEYHDVNVAGTQNLLEYAKDHGVKQFIFASSSSVYGVNQKIPWSEDDQLFPISPYASSKLSDEMLGHVYAHLYEIRFLALRFFTVYGPGQRPDLAIRRFFESIESEKPIDVYGDGSSSRDYTYVDDIIAGIMAAIKYEASQFEVINLGNGTPVSLNDIIKAIEDITGKKAVSEKKPAQPGDVPHTFADINKARRLLGYQPAMGIADGLAKFYQWYKELNKIEMALTE